MKIKYVLVLISLLIFTGCYNYNELNTLAIATGMSIDYEDDNYVVNLLIANSKQEQASSVEGESKSLVYEGKGETISEAIREIDIISPKKVYIGHLSFIVVSKTLAEHGLKDSLDYLIRKPESTKRFYLIVSKNKAAKDILQIVSPLESFPSQSISVAISFSKESQAVTSTIPYSSFIEKLLEKGVEPILPSIEIIGDIEEGKDEKLLETTTPTTYTKLSNLLLFKEDKLIAEATEEESEGINIINDAVDELLLTLNCNGGKVGIEVLNLNTDKKINTDLTVSINVKGKASIQENTCDIDLEDAKVIQELEEKANKEIDRLINSAVTLAKQNKTDIFGFGNLLYKKSPNQFKKIENTWNEEEFLKVTIKTNIKLNLESKGSLESYIKEAK